MDRSVITLFMLMSADGRINTKATDNLDLDRDLPKITSVQEGLHQYHKIRQTTGLWSFSSGRVQEELDISFKEMPNKLPVSFVMIDNHHLTKQGIRYFCVHSKEFMLAASDIDHLVFQMDEDNLHIICQSKPSLTDTLAQLKSEYNCQKITIQSGGILNRLFLREKLFDYIDIMIALILVGGKDTSTLIDGRSLLSESESSQLGVLKLQECMVSGNPYLKLRYQVIH